MQPIWQPNGTQTHFPAVFERNAVAIKRQKARPRVHSMQLVLYERIFLAQVLLLSRDNHTNTSHVCVRCFSNTRPLPDSCLSLCCLTPTVYNFMQVRPLTVLETIYQVHVVHCILLLSP